jgi:hypothetical protein
MAALLDALLSPEEASTAGCRSGSPASRSDSALFERR